MAWRKGEDAGTISTMRKLILFIVVTLILVMLFVYLKDRSLGLLDPLFNIDFGTDEVTGG